VALLDYEETLVAIQGLLGRHVTVSVAGPETGQIVAIFSGVLHSAEDVGATLRSENELAIPGEIMSFAVALHLPARDQADAAVFNVWQHGFEDGWSDGTRVYFRSGSTAISVDPVERI